MIKIFFYLFQSIQIFLIFLYTYTEKVYVFRIKRNDQNCVLLWKNQTILTCTHFSLFNLHSNLKCTRLFNHTTLC